MSDRYTKEHSHGDVRFYLDGTAPNEEQARLLMLKVLEQAVRDYCFLVNSEVQSERLTWESANGFLYNDEYYFTWGEFELNLEAFLDMLDLDIHWVREQTTKRFNKRNNNNGKESSRRNNNSNHSN